MYVSPLKTRGSSNPSPATFRTWESLVFRVLRVHDRPTLRVGARGSNPVVLTHLIRCGQTVRQLPVKESIEGSSPSAGAFFQQGRASQFGDGSRLESGRALTLPCEFDSRSFRLKLRVMAECLASNQRTTGSIPSARTPRLLVQRSSLEWTPPCHGGDHRFKSGMGRLHGVVRQRPSGWS